MLQSIWDDIKQEYNYGNMIKRIIIVNIAIYVFINLVWVFLNGVYPALYGGVVHFCSYFQQLVALVDSYPWSVLSLPYVLSRGVFSHSGICFFLFWFGRIFGDLLGYWRVLLHSIFGGLGGAVACSP